MNDTAIKVVTLSKRYHIGERRGYETLREVIAKAATRPLFRRNVDNTKKENTRSIWALKDIFFSLKRGEVLGIIGRNGAGKTTLLKILSRITEPTDGYCEINGRVGSLLEVGTGFHPELTGRENIFLNGAIIGMKKREIEAKFYEIVAFSEVEKFIDTPVKFYSSGMYVRLAFAVAAHLEPEILLVDEVLAVGDASFQKKCLGKMNDVAKEGRTVVFVSHNMAAINRLCNRVLWIDGGRIQAEGQPQDVIGAYITKESETGGERNWATQTDAPGTEEIRLRSLRIRSERKDITDTIDIRSPFWIEAEYTILAALPPMRIVIKVVTADGTTVFLARDNFKSAWEEQPRKPGTYVSRLLIPGELLNAGHYTVSVSAELPFVKIMFFEENVLRFSIQRTGGMGAQYTEPWPGVICPPLQWEVLFSENTS